MYMYANLHKKVASTTKPSLDFGTIIHKALEYRYSTCLDKQMTDDQKSTQANLINDFFAGKEIDEFEHRTANFACEIISRYNKKYLTEPFNVLADEQGKVLCEIPFSVPLYDATYKGTKVPIIFTGRIDLPVHWDGKVGVLDHKTTSMFFGPQRFLDEQRCSMQHRGYCWAFEKATGRTVEFFSPNGIPTKQPPAKPKQGIDNWWNEWFVRDITHLALYPKWREEWYEATCHMVDYVLWCHERGAFPQTGRFVRACENYGGCQFKDVCNQPPDKREGLLESYLFKNNEWSPLELTKQITK